jgi:hypothetical protein
MPLDTPDHLSNLVPSTSNFAVHTRARSGVLLKKTWLATKSSYVLAWRTVQVGVSGSLTTSLSRRVSSRAHEES